MNEHTFPLVDSGHWPRSTSPTASASRILCCGSLDRLLRRRPAVAVAIDINSMGYQALDEMLDGVDRQHQVRLRESDPRAAMAAVLRGSLIMTTRFRSKRESPVKATIPERSAGTAAAHLLPHQRPARVSTLSPRIGQEIDPYVESIYPAPGLTLYRTESTILAFNEKLRHSAGAGPTAAADRSRREASNVWTGFWRRS